MSFDRPGALALLALAVPIVLFHFYRGRITSWRVPTLLFWDSVIVEEERITSLRRLRYYVSLILNLLILMLLVAILSGPSFELAGEGRKVLFVLETTLRDTTSTGLEEMKGQVRHWLKGMRRSDEVALCDAAGVLVGFSRDRRGLEEALEQLRIRRSTAALEEALKGIPGEVERVRIRPAVSVPRLAIAEAREDRSALRIRVEGVEASMKARVRVEADGKTVSEHPVSEPGWMTLPRPPAGRIRVELLPHDEQPVDDFAYFVSPPSDPPGVRVVSAEEPNAHLMTALELLRSGGWVGGIESLSFGEFERVREDANEDVLTFIEGGRIERPGAGVTVCFGTESGAWALKEADPLPGFAWWDADHPLFDAVSLSSVSIRETRCVEGGRELARSKTGTIAVEGGEGGRAWIVFGFRFASSDLWGRGALPLMLMNLVTWFHEGAVRWFPRNISGEGILENQRTLSGEGVAGIDWTDGARSSREEVPYRDGTLRHLLVQPGFYRVEVQGRTEELAVTDAGGVSAAVLENPPTSPRSLSGFDDLSYSVVAGAIVTLLLILEWLIYARERR